MTARFMMIGLDGADGALLDRWTVDGTLPHLADLRARGAAIRLSAPAGVTDDGLWASFQYAAGLGEHGRYHYRQESRSGEMAMAHHDEVDRAAFWDSLSSHGLRVAVIDVPKCRLPRPINGIHLADWLVHGRYFREPKSHPESLAAEVLRRFGSAPPSRCGVERPKLSDPEVLEVVANLRTSAASKRAAGLHYLAAEKWDLFLIGFKEAHCAGHGLWDLVDPRCADYDAARTGRLGNPFRAIFEDLDAAVGDLVDAAGPDATIGVFSTTDIEPNATLIHLMPQIVNRVNRELGETLLARAIRRVGRRLSPASRKRLCELLPYNENCTALRISAGNGFGRLPIDGRDRAEMSEQVEAMVWELTDADTGRPVVIAVDRPSVEQGGTRAAALPDLLIRYAPGTFPRAVVSPRLGRIEAVRPSVRPGNHAVGGLLILTRGPVACVKSMEDLGPLASKALLHSSP